VRLAVLGVPIGSAASFVAACYVRDLLFQVGGRDPVVTGTVALALVLVAIMASLVPGVRGTKVDPVEALRAE